MPTEQTDVSYLFPKIKIDTKDVIDIWNAYTITEEFKLNTIASSVYLVEARDTWSTIAQKIYSDRRLWWVVALYNDVEDPFQLYYEYEIDSKITSLQIMNSEYIPTLLREIERRNTKPVEDFNIE